MTDLEIKLKATESTSEAWHRKYLESRAQVAVLREALDNFMRLDFEGDAPQIAANVLSNTARAAWLYKVKLKREAFKEAINAVRGVALYGQGAKHALETAVERIDLLARHAGES